MSEATTLAALAPRFDAFLVDKFGVLTDGTSAYEGAPEALSALAAAGKQVVVLSNSGKRSAQNVARMERLGFSRDAFLTVTSSGEVGHGVLAAMIGDRLPARPQVLLLTRDDDTSPVDGLDVALTKDAAAADIVLLAASRGDRMTLEAYRDLLSAAARRGTPCLNTNPDLKMMTPDGPTFGAGRIAELYEALGGPVIRVGKPLPAIYRAALAHLPHGARVLAVGDSPAHDVRGGRDAGLATALVRTGIHAELDDAQRIALCEREGAMPDFIIPRFAL